MAMVNEYLESITASQKAEFEKVRKAVQQLVPEAEEVISYGIPTFKYKKKPLLYFGAFKDHTSLFPTSDEMIKAIPELEKHRAGKSTLRFAESIPEPLLKKIILHRLAAINY